MTLRIIEDYLYSKDDIDHAFAKIKGYISEETTSRELNELDFRIMKYVFGLLPDFSDDFQQSVVDVEGLLAARDFNHFKEDQSKLRNIFRLFILFQNDGKMEDDSPDSSDAEIVGGFIDMDSHSGSLDAHTVRAQEVKKAQTARLEEFVHRLFDQYLSNLLEHFTEERFRLLYQGVLPRTQEVVIRFASIFCEKDPRGVIEFEKKSLIVLFDQLHQFLTDYSHSQSTLREQMSNFDELSLGDREILLIGQLAQLRHEQRKQIVIPTDLDSKRTDLNLQKLIEEICQLATEKFHLPMSHELHSLGLMILGPWIIDKILNPHVLSLLIHRFIEDDLDFTDLEVDTPPLGSFDASDLAFSETVGDCIENIGKDFIVLGAPSGAAKVMTKILRRILKSNKKNLGEVIQRSLNLISNSDSVIKPVLVLDHLLFKKGETESTATLRGCTERTDGEKDLFRDEVRTELQQRLYEVLLQNIQAQSTAAHWAASSAGSLKVFCDNLSSQIFHLTQQKFLMKLLFSYFLEGIKDMLTEWEDVS